MPRTVAEKFNFSEPKIVFLKSNFFYSGYNQHFLHQRFLMLEVAFNVGPFLTLDPYRKKTSSCIMILASEDFCERKLRNFLGQLQIYV